MLAAFSPDGMCQKSEVLHLPLERLCFWKTEGILYLCSSLPFGGSCLYLTAFRPAILIWDWQHPVVPKNTSRMLCHECCCSQVERPYVPPLEANQGEAATRACTHAKALTSLTLCAPPRNRSTQVRSDCPMSLCFWGKHVDLDWEGLWQECALWTQFFALPC